MEEGDRTHEFGKVYNAVYHSKTDISMPGQPSDMVDHTFDPTEPYFKEHFQRVEVFTLSQQNGLNDKVEEQALEIADLKKRLKQTETALDEEITMHRKNLAEWNLLREGIDHRNDVIKKLKSAISVLANL